MKKFVVAAAVVAGISAFFYFDLGAYLDLGYLRSEIGALRDYYTANPLRTAGVFFLVYVAVTALSLPGAAVMTLFAGALFGLGTGTLLVSFASTAGATLAFLIARILLRDMLEARFQKRLAAINRGVERDGAFYLFTLRLVPVFPFFLINLLMGLTRIRTWVFYVVSQIGMLPGTLVYVNAGERLGEIEKLADVASPSLLFAFALLGLFPWLARAIVEFARRRRMYAAFDRPRRFDTNLVVIGAGSAGLVTAYIAAAVKAKVTLIERDAMGGDCLNTGCVPSKALLRSAKVAQTLRHSAEYGLESPPHAVNFGRVMARVHETIATIAPHDSVERYTSLGVDCIQGEARITSPFTVEVDGRTITTRSIVIATGGGPFVPPLAGLEDVGYLTSNSVWSLTALPERLVVLGGGPIGCELAQAFASLGATVTQVEMGARLLPREDPEVSELMLQRFTGQQIDVRLQTKAERCERRGDAKLLICETSEGERCEIPFDELLVAVGRRANTAGLGLEEIGIPVNQDGTVETDDTLRTRYPNIYACGDVAGPYQFTHTAAHQAWYASVNALFGGFRRFRADYSVIPWCTFTSPEVAHVGLNEQEARDRGVDFEVTRYELAELDRAIADSETSGFVKVLTRRGKDRILGVTIVGEHAGEMIAEYVLAMKHGLGLNKILGTIHTYPTLMEANKYAAGEWKKAHAPEGLLAWLGRFHRWRLG